MAKRKIELESKFPVDVPSFLGHGARNISFNSTGESEFVSLLLDGNRTVYPLVKDSTTTADSIRDPMWLDLPPVSSVGLGTHALPHVSSGLKNEVAVIVFSFSCQQLMPKILRCDLEGVRSVLTMLEADPASPHSLDLIQKILDERCDGGRNILHTSDLAWAPPWSRCSALATLASRRMVSLAVVSSGHSSGVTARARAGMEAKARR